jgi:RNA polymerase sigma factor (sigma-70 family)
MPTLTPRLLRLASDARLVGLVREGRDAAFEAIYDRHHRPILSFCRHMLGDADEAEDAVQHTFMAAYTDLLTSDKPIHLRAWLFTIARNRCYTILRSRREHPTAELEEAATEGLAAEVQRRQDLRDLVNDMRRLPEEQRAALVLAELDALSHTDIAEVLGVPREKVKALVFQARESLLASRNARDTACSEIREQLACGRGATLRRANLRRHLRECDGCRAYRAQVDRQRKQFAVLLPVVPGVALKQAVFSGGGGAAGASAAVGGGALVSTALKGGAIKGIVAVIAASVSTAGTVVVATGNLPVSSLLHTVTHTFGGGSSAPRTHHAIASARAHTAEARDDDCAGEARGPCQGVGQDRCGRPARPQHDRPRATAQAGGRPASHRQDGDVGSTHGVEPAGHPCRHAGPDDRDRERAGADHLAGARHEYAEGDGRQHPVGRRLRLERLHLGHHADRDGPRRQRQPEQPDVGHRRADRIGHAERHPQVRLGRPDELGHRLDDGDRDDEHRHDARNDDDRDADDEHGDHAGLDHVDCDDADLDHVDLDDDNGHGHGHDDDDLDGLRHRDRDDRHEHDEHDAGHPRPGARPRQLTREPTAPPSGANVGGTSSPDDRLRTGGRNG